MSNKILVTDSLFIFDEHIKQLGGAGYEIERLDKPEASEEELIAAIKGKVGYILGGIEHVTQGVLDAADQLKAISLNGIGFKTFIPAWENATKKGIAISNTPEGPTHEVAEWATTACLIMNRNFLEVGRVGNTQFMVTKGIESQQVGVIGLGRVGTRITEMLQAFKPQSIKYYSQHRKEDKEQSLGITYLPLLELLQQSDIIFLCVSDEAKNLLDNKELKSMKQGALLVNITHPGIINEKALFEVLNSRSIRAVSDYPMSNQFDTLPLSHWYCMNNSNTVTEAGAKLMSDMSTQSMLNLLATGNDQNLVNPDYRKQLNSNR